MNEMEAKELVVTTSAPIPPDVEGMRYLYELGEKSRDFKAVEIGGRVFVNYGDTAELVEIEPYEPKVSSNFETFTLSGLVRWLREDLEKHFEQFPRLYVRVEDPSTVTICTPGHGRYTTRFNLAYCRAATPEIRFDRYMSQEDFLIHLQTRFASNLDTGEDVKNDYDTVAALAGNVRMENEAQTADDGVSQRVTIKDGVSAVAEAVVKNPFTLLPKRTFEEIAQPASPFVLRIRKGNGGPEIALYESDGGAWKNEAVKRLGAWLEEQLADLPVVVIA